MQEQPNFISLQARWERNSETFPDEFNLRMRRSLSWLGRAENEMSADDPDAAFVFYWIAFNAVYVEGTKEFSGERYVFSDYFDKIIELDGGMTIYNLIWEEFSDPIRNLLDNQYVFEPFWRHYNGMPGYQDWEDRFDRSRRLVHQFLAEQNTKGILSTLFDRLYVLRNQLLHGGATWRGSLNRPQVKDGARIISSLVPQFVALMMDHPESNWGGIYYPAVRS